MEEREKGHMCYIKRPSVVCEGQGPIRWPWRARGEGFECSRMGSRGRQLRGSSAAEKTEEEVDARAVLGKGLAECGWVVQVCVGWVGGWGVRF
jgi:hypothetical protein